MVFYQWCFWAHWVCFFLAFSYTCTSKIVSHVGAPLVRQTLRCYPRLQRGQDVWDVPQPGPHGVADAVVSVGHPHPPVPTVQRLFDGRRAGRLDCLYDYTCTNQRQTRISYVPNSITARKPSSAIQTGLPPYYAVREIHRQVLLVHQPNSSIAIYRVRISDKPKNPNVHKAPPIQNHPDSLALILRRAQNPP